ncbi:Retrovirus-related Pol polyprotein from transposon TNT 1-94 [Vitis vinifera]|uniref:Retrovirus-related Pol polyprotein from transposon TNT 1-94 n=1 Tax=Vitis vinifera TaxID=29760 RepID=A0A438F2T7_VITVI|nr:Retrovirus-related Pol polyprotein from transposon TNT 1-94 [Vitis vinifera]
MMILLGCMDIDLALRMPKPNELNEESTQEHEVYWGKWERSNRLSLMIMKRGIPEAFRGAKRFAKNDKAETSTLLASLISMKYKGKGNVREYIMEMSHLASKLKALKLELSDDLLVHWFSSLFLHNLINSRLKQDKTESAHLASTSKDNGKRKNKDNKVAASNGPEQKKQKVEVTCFFCNKPGHTKKECTKYAAWRVKKGLLKLAKTKYDGSGEQRPGPFAKYLEECGIVPQYTMPGSPSMNGVAEDETELLRTWSIFETGTATFFEDVEFGGEIRLVSLRRKRDLLLLLIMYRYKARLVAKGFTQKEGIDFKETFSPVSTKDSFRIIMALVAHYDFELHQMDVKTAFLNGDIDETIYMVQPENFVSEDSKNMVCKLTKSIYGLKQASRQWYFKFHQIIVSYGFEANLMDECVYHKFSGSKYIFLVLYVDDILLATNDISILHDTKSFLSKHFEMKDLGDASFVLGIQIHRDRSRGILGLSQRTYIDKVLQRYGMQNSKPGDTPVAKGDKFSLNQCPKNSLESQEMQKIPYASAVGSLMYAQRTKEYMLTYRRLDQLEFIGYSDSDFAGCQDSRRSTSGYIYLLAGGAISWRSAKQTLITSSTMEAEFVACYEASNQGIWLRNFVTGLRVLDGIERPLKIFCDNKSAVLYSNNNRSSTKSKYIDIKFLVVKEKVQSGQISIEHIGTNSMIADPLTKRLPPKVFMSTLLIWVLSHLRISKFSGSLYYSLYIALCYV